MVLALAIAVPWVAGCGDDEPATPAVEVKDFKFLPAEIEVDAGTTIRWTNEDQASHTATSQETGVFDTGTIRTGQTKTAALRQPGTIAYICDFHPFMKATITVRSVVSR